MINIRVAAVLLSAVLSGSCTHTPRTTNVAAEYIIIGPGGGFRPPTGTYYLLTGSSLTADTAVSLVAPPSTLKGFTFNFQPPASKYEAVKGALSEVPSELLMNNHAAIGIDKSHVDGGYTVVRARIGGTDYDWKLHDDLGSASGPIKSFAGHLREVFKN